MGASNFHEELVREPEVRRTLDRRFGAVFAFVFALIGFVPLWHHGHIRWWSLAASGLLCLASLAAPGLLSPFNQAWYGFGLLLHRIVSPVMMAIIFYGVITPAGAISRLLRKDPLQLKMERGLNSYWICRDPPGPDAGGFPRMY